MSRESILVGVIGLLLGVLLTVSISANAVNNNMVNMMQMMGQQRMMDMDSSMSMEDMMESLENKSGDEFDKAFLSNMINHHQGAIEMAKMAKLNAKHEEIKRLADSIISSQTKEIEQMKNWQKSWGY